MTLVYVFLLIMASGVGLLWFWLLWPEYPLMLKHPIQVIEVQQFGASNTVIYTMDYCKDQKYANLDSEVHYMLVNHDAVLHELPGMAMGTLPFGCNVVKIALPLPLLQPGVYILRMIRLYHVNPLRPIEVASESPPFEVVASKEISAPVAKSLTGQPQGHPPPEKPAPRLRVVKPPLAPKPQPVPAPIVISGKKEKRPKN
jgi:hypothetical protein